MTLDSNPSADEDDVDFRDAAFAMLKEQRRQQLASMTEEDRYFEFLGWCIRRGSKYIPGRSPLPNISQLAEYCQCATSTIYRIAMRKTRLPTSATMQILKAIACLDPPAPVDQINDERRARMRDADRWVAADQATRGDIMDVLLEGIHARSTGTPC